MGRCELCGANLALVGWAHKCRPVAKHEAVPVRAGADGEPVPDRDVAGSSDAGDVGTGVADDAVHSAGGDVVSSGVRAQSTQVERNRRWRAKHRERYNAYMRDYRKRRKLEGVQT